MKEQKKISSAVLEKIEKGRVKPKPKWEYLLKNYVFWGLGFSSIIVGGAATSVIIFTLVNNDWDVYRYLNGSAWKNFIFMLPYLWFIFFILFAYVAHYNLKHTRHGYRYGLFSIVFVTVVASIILGFGFYCLGLSHAIDSSFKNFPGHKLFLEKRQEMLVQPEKGILAGTIKSIEENGNFKFEDFSGKDWTVLGSDLKEPHKVFVEGDSVIVIIGERINDDSFRACALRPLHVRGGDIRMGNKFMEKIEKKNIKMPDKKEIQKRMNKMEGQFPEGKNFDERRLLHMRSIMCGDGRP